MTEQAPLVFGYFEQHAVAIVLSVVAAIILGWWTIRIQRDIAKANLTFETIDRTIWDNDYIDKRKDFIKLRDSGRGLAIYAEPPPDPENIDDHILGGSAIRSILNDYENIAIGVRRGILDEEYLYRYMKSQVTNDWEATSSYVTALRTRWHNQNYFVEFEGLASQWVNGMSYHRQERAMASSKRSVRVE